MPRKAHGTAFVSDGAVYASVTIAPRKRLARALPGIEGEAVGREWAAVLQSLVDALHAAGRSAEVTEQIERAISVGVDDSNGGLARVRAGVAKLRAGTNVAKISTVGAATKGSAITFKKFAQRWTSGELHDEFPDHVKEKKTADKDAGALEMHVYPRVGHVRLADFTLKHAQDVLRHVPRERSSSVRRQVAQLLGRVLKLAVYPCELLKSSPLPPGFLPSVKVRPGAYLYPSEDAALLACRGTKGKPGVPLANRLLYGFLAREGMRKEEALLLAWSDVDLERGAVRLDTNKTDDPRAWALDRGVTAALAWWKTTHHRNDKPSALVFADVADPEHLPDVLRAHLKLAGVDRAELFEHTAKRRRINVHGLRSTFVTVSLASGKSETWVQDRTGHRSSTMVNRYRRVARTAAELGLGALAPLDRAIPEIEKRSGRRR